MSSMRDAEHLVMDGTLKSLHDLFYQLFTVHGLFPDVCHFSLYRNLLTEIDSYSRKKEGAVRVLLPLPSVQCDYELAIHNAVAEVRRHGSQYHEEDDAGESETQSSQVGPVQNSSGFWRSRTATRTQWTSSKLLGI